MLRQCVIRLSGILLAAHASLCPPSVRAYVPEHGGDIHRRADGSWDDTREYAYSNDGAGNVVRAGRVDAVGQGRAAFEANALNFHVVRRWNAVDLVGVALPAARVMVNGRLAPRDGARFVFPLPLTDGTPAHLTNLTVTAALDDGNAEQYATRTVTLRIPACPETIDVALASATVGDSLAEYLFDARNRLRRVTDKVGEPRLRAVYDYYPDGRRARKIVSVWTNDAWQAACTNQFLYDRWNLVREVVTDDGTVTTRDYTWGLDLAGLQDGSWGQESGGIGGLLAITEVSGTSTNILLPISDHVGTIHGLVAVVTDNVTLETPAAVAEYDYAPYGELISADGPFAGSCPFGFQTKYRDPETGFWYYGYRYYDAKSCKWLTADPLGEAGGLNLTAFCGGDPVNQVDALGLEPQNVIQLFMPGSATSHPYRNYGDFTDAARWRPLELSQIGAATDPNAWSTIGQVVVAGAGAGAAVGLAGVGAVVLAEAVPLAYVAAWGTTLGGTATVGGGS